MNYQKITISGKICTGKSSLFKELQKRLNWPTFSSGAYFRDYAKKHRLVLNDAAEQTERLTMKVDMMVREKLKQQGHLLLDAWLGGILAEDAKGVLKVLLVADDAERFRRFAEREHVALPEAEKEVIQRDKSWYEKVSVIHKRHDFFDKNNYDMVIDTTNLKIHDIVTLVMDKLNTK